MRRYQGFMADSGRWERFPMRPDDVIISTPSKCGTTWMQNIVGMLLLDRTDLGASLSNISPWLDMQIRTEAEAFDILDRQTHRRFIKTHTPFDGLPYHESVTYICVIRHPLDVALSDRDHMLNMLLDKAVEMREAAVGRYEPPADRETAPDDPGDYLRWFIDRVNEPSGSGPYGLFDYCHQTGTYWDVRDRPNVHLFHYADMWSDLDGEMRRVAEALHVAVDEARWPTFVEAATFDSMRARASVNAPDAHIGLWKSPEGFFRSGGTRKWASLLTAEDIAHFDERLNKLAGDSVRWILRGRAALPEA